jgi:hypothetical protein
MGLTRYAMSPRMGAGPRTPLHSLVVRFLAAAPDDSPTQAKGGLGGPPAKALGIPYTRFIRETLEQAVMGAK